VKRVLNENIAPSEKTAPNERIVPNEKTAPNEKAAPNGKTAPNEKTVPSEKIVPLEKSEEIAPKGTKVLHPTKKEGDQQNETLSLMQSKMVMMLQTNKIKQKIFSQNVTLMALQ